MLVDKLDWLLFFVTVVHLVICPYTKVEESFNMQAMHDILYHRFHIEQYDHLEFPGVVPRTFLGPLIVSLVASPFVYAANALHMSKFCGQYIVRLCLGVYVLWTFRVFRRGVKLRFGPNISFWLVLITASQFHFLFYATRPLPNTFAMGLVLLSLNSWMRQNYAKFIWISAAAVLIFRCELCLFFGIVSLSLLLKRKIRVMRTLKLVAVAGPLLLAMTVLMDSVFWQRWTWPEGEVLWFNTVLNKSSQWGTLPFWWYFYSAIPRTLSFSCFLLPLGVYLSPSCRTFLLPAILFALLYSFLPHKELRFIIYIFPILNVAVAFACNRIWKNKSKSWLWFLAGLGCALHLVTNLGTTAGFLLVSHHNYPGGEALHRLHHLEPPTSAVYVHIDVPTAQTGVTRFGQLNPQWRYNKTENLSSEELKLQFTHLLVDANRVESGVDSFMDTHKVVDKINGFHKLRINLEKIFLFEIIVVPKIYILKKKTIANS